MYTVQGVETGSLIHVRVALCAQDGPKPAWRYLVEPKETKGELPSPTGPRPRVHDGLYRGSDGDNVYADRNRSQEFR